MDRLTTDTTGKTGIGLTFDLDVSCANMDTAERLQDLIVRLGELEKAVSDSNGQYDIDRLRQLSEVDRDGRCVVLPTPLTATDVEAIKDIGRIVNNLDTMAELVKKKENKP